MATAALNIREYVADRLEITPREGIYDPNIPVLCQVELGFAAAADESAEHSFRVALRVRLHADGLARPANLPYFVTINLQGAFDTPVRIAPTAIPASLVLNALMILYGVARGIVGDATNNFAHGRVVLPSVSFDSIVEKASRDSSTPVVPSPDMLRPGDPVAAAFFRFNFAIEDFSRVAALLGERDREKVLGPFRDLMQTFNRLPLDPDGAVGELDQSRQAVIAALDEVDHPIAAVLRMHVDQISSGVDLALKTEANRRVAATIKVPNESSAESPRRGKKNKSRRSGG